MVLFRILFKWGLMKKSELVIFVQRTNQCAHSPAFLMALSGSSAPFSHTPLTRREGWWYDWPKYRELRASEDWDSDRSVWQRPAASQGRKGWSQRRAPETPRAHRRHRTRRSAFCCGKWKLPLAILRLPRERQFNNH